MGKTIWLFGENEGKTMNNNSFYFWKKTCNINDEIEKYYIAIKNKKNLNIYNSLSEKEKKLVVWKNTNKHWKLFYASTLHLVTLSYKDVTPNKILGKSVNLGVRKPIAYLQHGTIAIKKLEYIGNGYGNKFFRFFIYNESIIPSMISENDFKPYQLYYAKYHPRYMELIKRNNELKDKNQILYFLTWREYLGNNKETNNLISNLESIFTNDKLINYLKNNSLKMKVCLHQFFDEKKLSHIKIDKDLFDIVHPSKIDVMDELAKSKLLITDYSSIGFDFTFLNKPVILFSPDMDDYLRGRSLYCTVDELKKYSIMNVNTLVDGIVNENYSINDFFKSRLPKDIDYDYILNGNHIIDMYNYLRDKERNKIVFLGYKFGGSGGTVSATKSLVSSLASRGYFVEMLSLKGTSKDSVTAFPYGVCEIKLSDKNGRFIVRKYEKLSKKIATKYDKKMLSLKYDSSKKYMDFDIGVKLKKYLDTTNAKTIVSTRESLHPILSKINNESIKNKIYFFHTDAKLFDNIFPGLNKDFDSYKYDKMAYVSKQNYELYKEKFNLKSDKYSIVGNCIDDEKIIDKNLITGINKKDKYKGICLTRLSTDRKNDLDNIIEFGIKLKNDNINNYEIDVYGNGNYVDEFNNLIKENKIEKYISYKGLTTQSFNEIRKHDFLIDFSNNQSFGMIYLEGCLAGKKVYAKYNDASIEVLGNMKDTIYKTYDELIDYLSRIDTVSSDELIHNYEYIMNKYSKDVITNKFISLID